MAYVKPYIDASGLHLNTYQDILDQLIADYKQIFGNSVYLDTDSQDYQLLSVFALKIYDTEQAVQLAYNSRSPQTAIGSALDGLLPLNGLVRKTPTYSTCLVVLSGIAGTIISNGIIKDTSGYQWDLPETVTIGEAGTATVIATCETIGAITAAIGTINQIVTPTYGWTSVTNTVAAVPGQSVETDSQVKSRQADSTASPSQTILEGLTGAIAAVSGVTRYAIYENDTNALDSNNLPPHSITAVVEGGTDNDIATAIYQRKTLGCYTNGSVSVDFVDNYGLATTIRFSRPSNVEIVVSILIKKLAGYTDTITTQIQNAVINYLNNLKIGQLITISGIEGQILSLMPDIKNPIFSIRNLQIAISGNTPANNDLQLNYNQVSITTAADVTITFA